MPSRDAHLRLAEANQKAIDYLLLQYKKFSDWITTVAFYKALHLVEALFAKEGRHGQSHERRERILKTERKYQHIYKHYYPLLEASLVARYLEDREKGEYGSFSEYLAPDEVKTEILNYRLKNIERSVKKLLSPAKKRRKR